ncbi:T9SS type A sorting domain-containing protein [Fluviicola sp.]|uniref:T9SS type A sorting domain-containing protein n=1 Tax=Fluviicola sp. TaxID=1917219 RepID=UPI003D2DCFD1
MKKLFLLLTIFPITGVFGQSDNCTGTPPTLTVGTTCTPTAYSIPTSFFDNFSSEPSCGWDDVDGFFQFTATSTYTNVTLTDATPAGPNPGLMVVSGTCGGTLTSLGCSQAGNGTNESVSFNTVIGQVYLVVIFATNAANTGPPTSATTGTICVTQSTYTGPVVASECASYVNICSNAGFQIDPNGYGAINEIPVSGSLGNPEYDPFWGPLSPWGGGNMGCLQVGENNSTWMVINVYTAGNLAFSFGAGGAQAGYYDWIMYPYTGPSTCGAISSNTLAPVRCNWNAVNYGGTGLTSTLPAGGDWGNYEPVLPVAANTQYIICFSNYSSVATTVPIVFNGTATVGCSALGINTSNFTVNTDCENDAALISWEAPLENSSTYQVQRSYTGEAWEIIGTVVSANSSDESTQFFSFRDALEKDKVVFYRLKETNPDQISSYSELKAMSCKSGISPNTLSPNPSSELTNLTYYSKQAGTLHIFDAVGRPIEQISLENTNGKIVLKPIDVSGLQAGAYRFVVDLGTESSTIQFIKK